MGLRLGCARTVQPTPRLYSSRSSLVSSAMSGGITRRDARSATRLGVRCGDKVGKARKPEDYVRCTCECHPPDMVPLVTRSTGQHHEHKFDWVPFRCERCGQNRLKLASCCEQWAAVCIRCE
jgi:hypothetical protein